MRWLTIAVLFLGCGPQARVVVDDTAAGPADTDGGATGVDPGPPTTPPSGPPTQPDPVARPLEVSVDGQIRDVTAVTARTYGCCSGYSLAFEGPKLELFFPLIDVEDDQLACPFPVSRDGGEEWAFDMDEFSGTQGDCDGVIQWDGPPYEPDPSNPARAFVRDATASSMAIHLKDPTGEERTVVISGSFRASVN